MSKKTKKAVAEPRKMTKRQLSKHQQERRWNVIALTSAAAIFALVIAVLGFGLYREVLAKPGEAIARVDGQDIALGDYAKLLGYANFNLDLQKLQLQNIASQGTAGSTEPGQDALRQYAQQSLQQLELRRYSLPDQVLETMIEDRLIRREAARRNITVSDAEIDDILKDQFSPAPAISSPITGTDQVTNTDAVAATGQITTGDRVTGTMTVEQATEELRKALAQTGFFTVEEYRDTIIKGSIYREKLSEALGNEIPTTGEQVRARHILVDTEDEAKEILRRLRDEGQDFEVVAREVSKDEGTKDKGGDLDWFPRGMMTKPFEDAAFQLQPGELSDPVQSEFGYHIVRVDERADDKLLGDDMLAQLKAGALLKWLSEQKVDEANRVQTFDTAERIKWATDWISSKQREAAKRNAPAAK